LKKFLVLFCALVSIFSFLITYTQIEHTQIEDMENIEKNIAREFTIPKNMVTATPETLYPMLLETAKEYNVNVFRPSINYNSDDKVELIKYILLTNETHFYDAFKLKNGDFLNPSKTQRGDFFLSNVNTTSKKQTGEILNFGNNSNVMIKTLKDSYKYLPIEGQYFAEAHDKQTFKNFLNSFVLKINKKYNQSLSIDDFTKSNHSSKNHTSSGLMYLTYIYYIVILIILLFLIYYIFNESKRVGIMKIHGVSDIKIWSILIGKLITVSFSILTIVLVIIALFIENTMWEFIYKVAIYQMKTYIIIILISLISYIFISKMKINEAIKNKKNTNEIFILNVLLKIICSIILISFGFEMLNQYNTIKIKQENMKNWTHSKDYGIFYPLYVGHDQEDIANGQRKNTEQINGPLYHTLNNMGAILINATAYEADNLRLNSDYKGINSVKVNNNYLQEFPVYDVNNIPIKVSENETTWVLLVPEKYRMKSKEILKFFKQDRRDFKDAEEEFWNKKLSKDIKKQKIKIIWTKNKQDIFSFNPEVFKYQNNMIKDPIIQVITENNSLNMDKSSILGNGSSDPLKIKLIRRDSDATYQKLEPQLKKLKLDDNLRHLITVDQYSLQEIHDLQKQMNTVLIVISGMLAGLLIINIQTVIVSFNKNHQKYTVNRLFGISFIKTYRPYLLLLLVSWVIQVIVCLMMNKGFDVDLLIIASILIFLELICSIFTIIIIEKRSIIKYLKGGF